MTQISPSKGERFGRLLVTRDDGPAPNQRDRYVICLCDCGTIKEIWIRSLRRGLTVSCGCFNRERTASTQTKHGLSKTTEYYSWRAMISRCRDEDNDSYDCYGGRGIKVCDEWGDDFERFLADMGKKPTRNSQIDRIDNEGNYEPGNCRWSSPLEQGRNRRTNVLIEHNGTKLTAAAWAEIHGIKPSLIRVRRRRGVVDPIRLFAPPRMVRNG